MSGDDDTIIIRHKLAAIVTKPVTWVKRWHLIALFVMGVVVGKLL